MEKSIAVREETWKRLKLLGSKDETFDEIITKLLNAQRKRPILIGGE